MKKNNMMQKNNMINGKIKKSYSRGIMKNIRESQTRKKKNKQKNMKKKN